MKRAYLDRPADGWDRGEFAPEPGNCKECGESIPRTRKRGEAFGGWGRPREFCGAACRKRASRRTVAKRR